MLRLILIFIVGVFVAVGVLAVALYHFFGVKGLIAFPFVILALMWVAKWMVKSLVKKFASSLFGMKARALRGATMNVHSIKVVPKPPEPDVEDEDEDPPSSDYGAASEDPPSPGSRLRDAPAFAKLRRGETARRASTRKVLRRKNRPQR
jgi:hypothetical protein